MAACEKLAKCPFFNGTMARMPAMTELFKREFCHGSNGKCARYRVSASGQDVPPDLFPNHHERADKILAIRNNSMKISYGNTQQ
jgi:methyl-accepting chemotaxis protein